MSIATIPAPAETEAAGAARPGSRAARMAHPTAIVALRQVAADHGVCIRPLAMRTTNLATGETSIIDLPCGSTREKVCPPCAAKAKRLRQVQCRQGWHRDDEPVTPPTVDDDQAALLLLRADLEYARADCLARGRWDQVAECDQAIGEVEAMMTTSGLRGAMPSASKERAEQADGQRRRRSTRRRQDVPDLPRRKVTARTVGRMFASAGGKVYRPSTFLTVTLDSYGRVREDGSPVDPGSYDYRRAAWDAVHFPALLDRFWQNLRRAEGWNVQYFGAIEPQRRLAPHAHFAIRGTMPHATLRRVVAATYHQVWWPPTDVIRYPEQAAQPVWDGDEHAYRDPTTGEPLPTWAEAMAALDDELDADPDREPEHVSRFGVQVKPVGVLAGTPEAERLIGYLSKYITKSVGECHGPDTAAAQAHQRRLWEQLRYTPCSPRCPNWLRYGVQPQQVRPKLRAGHCRAKVHQLDTLGLGGRRVLVSRDWTGKTLADHRYDQLAWVRRVLRLGLSDDTDDQDQAATAARDGEAPAPIVWELARPGEPGVANLATRLLRLISTRIQHRAVLDAARAADPPGGDVSATAMLGGGDG